MTATQYIKEEEVILVDTNDQEIGKAEKILAHKNNLLHRAFSVFIFRPLNQSETTPSNSQPFEIKENSEILLQQRAFGKYHSGGLWTNTCCSHPRAGETVIAAGERRLAEEFGIKTKLEDIGWFHYVFHFSNGLSENENDHVLIGLVENDQLIVPNPEEIYNYRWIKLEQLKQELAGTPHAFTPWLSQALLQVETYVNSKS